MDRCSLSRIRDGKVLGWPKSLLRFPHNILEKAQTNFSANPVDKVGEHVQRPCGKGEELIQ